MEPIDFTQYGSIGVYAIIMTIGTGGTCKVKLAINTTNGERVAIKILNSEID